MASGYIVNRKKKRAPESSDAFLKRDREAKEKDFKRGTREMIADHNKNTKRDSTNYIKH